MAGIKIEKFLGIAPKISPELLPNAAGQIANNCKLYSGDLIPYPQPVVIDSTERTIAIKSLYILRDPVTDEKKWLTWTSDVDIAGLANDKESEQRFYFTGDGVPKVSDYKLATSGAEPYPVSAYDLGLPLPDTELSTVAQALQASSTTASYSRASNVATITTSAAHGLVTDDSVNINGFTELEGTYSDNGTSTTTITITGHGLSTGASVTLEFTTGSGVAGIYTATRVDDNVFTVAVTAGAPDTGDVNLDLSSFNNASVEVTVVDSTTFTYINIGFDSTTVPYTASVINKAGTISASRARDSSNLATIVTEAPHLLRSGNVASITGFPVGTNTVSTFNATNVVVTILNATTITYFSPGEAVSTVADGSGKVTLSGLTQARSYVYTWYTPWEEESIGSLPSDELFIKEGITVTVSNIPNTPPAGVNFIRGVRIYRTLPTASGTEYFLLNTLWFPGTVALVKRTANISTVTTTDYHNLNIDDRFKISGCTSASFNITGGIVTDVIDSFTFEFEQTAADVTEVAATGTLYYDVAENTTKPARYWGDANYNFIDDFDSRNLFTILDTDEYDPPPDDLKGLTVMQNSIYVGFAGNKIYFSEPSLPHAWPQKYIRTIEHDIVAIAVISGFLLVLTDSYPYQITGTNPNVMSVNRIDAQYPCVSKRSVVVMSYGVIYATHDGLALYSPSAGPIIITKLLQVRDTWETDLDPSTLIGEFYGDKYFASWTKGSLGGSIVFERDDQVGGFYVDTPTRFCAAHYDGKSGDLYYSCGDDGKIYQWDDLAQPLGEQQWKSKVIVTKDYLNLGAARIIADFTGSDVVTFSMWANKELIYTADITDESVFRLPSGYLTDTIEVSVKGSIRVKAIHLAETPIGLKEA